MTDTLRNERAAIERYLTKHFTASAQADYLWYMAELRILDCMIQHDPESDFYIDWRARNWRYSQTDSYPMPR